MSELYPLQRHLARCLLIMQGSSGGNKKSPAEPGFFVVWQGGPFSIVYSPFSARMRKE